jgi:large subunit ribosomal protein L25
MAERITIPARPRTVLGKKVRQLRREGRLPANVYGRGVDSTAVDVDAREFLRTVRHNGIRVLYDLQVEGESTTRPVIVRGIARYGGTGDPIHVDFFQVDPERPIQATVPLRLVGEAPAVRDLAGTLLQSIEMVSIRCAPLAMPEVLEVSMAKLTSFSQPLTVGDIEPPPGVEVVTDPSIVIASVAPPRIRATTPGRP